MGGYTVDIYWKEGKLDKSVLTAALSKRGERSKTQSESESACMVLND